MSVQIDVPNRVLPPVSKEQFEALKNTLFWTGKEKNLAFDVKRKFLIALNFLKPVENIRVDELSPHEAEIFNALCNIDKIASEIIRIYLEELHIFDVDPGIIEIYLVGGRVKGKEMTATSDLDIVIAAQNPERTFKFPDTQAGNEMSYNLYLEKMQHQLIEKFSQVLSTFGIHTNILHIVSWGTDINEITSNNKAGVFIASSADLPAVSNANSPPTS